MTAAPGVFVFGRIDGHGGLRDVVDEIDGLAGDEVGFGAHVFGCGRGMGVGRGAGPDGNLGVAAGGLPEIGLRTDAATRENDEGGEGKGFPRGTEHIPIAEGRQCLTARSAENAEKTRNAERENAEKGEH